MPPRNSRRTSNRASLGRVSKPKTATRTKKAKTALNSHPQPKSTPLDVFVWGTGSMCELGLGPAAKTKEVKRPRLNPFLPRDSVGVVDIAVGGMHTLVLDKSNKVWSWGANDAFVLGRETSLKEKLKDMGAESDDDDDGDLNEAEATPGLVENLPTDVENHKIVQLAATDNLSAVLYENGDVYAWGTFRCSEGLLGFSETTKFQKTPQKMDLKDIVQLAAGKDHILALDASGAVYGWGDGQQYQLGRKIMERTRLQSLKPLPVALKNIKYIAAGDYHSFAIDAQGNVFAWGLNQYGQCGTKAELVDGDVVTRPTKVTRLGNKVVAIAGGEHHSLAVDEEGKLYAFGRVDMCELGIKKENLPDYSFKDEHGRVRAVPFPTVVEGIPKMRSVAAGSHHSLAITQDGVVFSWGYGDTYAVGQGPDGDDIEVPTRIKNTATQEHDILVVGCGGQFSVSGGVKSEDWEKREDNYESD